MILNGRQIGPDVYDDQIGVQEFLNREIEDRQKRREKRKRKGRLSVCVGPTDSGKTQQLAGEFRALQEVLPVQFFVWGLSQDTHPRPESSKAKDVSYPPEVRKVRTATELYAQVKPRTEKLYVDDVQYFDADIVQALDALATHNEIDVLAAGRELDPAGRIYSHVAELLAIADRAEKRSAICPECIRTRNSIPSMPATRTLLLIGGQPADLQQLVTAASDEVEFKALCRHHHRQALIPGQLELGLWQRIEQLMLQVLTGPMLAGKTKELIVRLNRYCVGYKVQAFKHILDTQRFPDSADILIAHSGDKYPAQSVHDSYEIQDLLHNDTEVVGIDEAQFFDEGIMDLVEDLTGRGQVVLIAGLDMNFRGAPFGYVPQLLALADDLNKKQAICMRCWESGMTGFTATRTQKLVLGHPAPWDSQEIMPGDMVGGIKYEPVCRHHYEITGPRSLQFRS